MKVKGYKQLKADENQDILKLQEHRWNIAKERNIEYQCLTLERWVRSRSSALSIHYKKLEKNTYVK
jgi:hypothetical protein